MTTVNDCVFDIIFSVSWARTKCFARGGRNCSELWRRIHRPVLLVMSEALRFFIELWTTEQNLSGHYQDLQSKFAAILTRCCDVYLVVETTNKVIAMLNARVLDEGSEEQSVIFTLRTLARPERLHLGLTLIEALITVLFMSLLVGLSLPNIGVLQDSASTAIALRRLAQALESAKISAISSGETVTLCGSANRLVLPRELE